MALCKFNPEIPVLEGRDINLVRYLIKNPSWVVSAVDNLKVVEKILQDENFEDHKITSDSVNNIISCLKTLDDCRLQLHEELEIQSIRGFIVKQTFAKLPNQIKGMIEAAVFWARNEAERIYKSSEDEMDFLTSEVKRLQMEILKIEQENFFLPKQEKRIESEETKIIDEFNAQLQYKLELKVKLRMLREEIREENQKMVDMEAEIMKMKKNLIGQRVQAREEMMFYETKIEKEMERKNSWAAKAETVRPSYTEVMTKAKARQKVVNEMKSFIQSEDHKMSTTARLRGTYMTKMKMEQKVRDNLLERKQQNMDALSRLKLDFENRLAQGMKRCHELEMKIMFEKSRAMELGSAEKEVQKVLDFFVGVEEDAKKIWDISKDKLDTLKSRFSAYETELLKRMSEHAEELKVTQEIDTALLDRIKKMKVLIDTLLDTLNLKKNARIEIEQMEENILRQLDQVRIDRDQFEADTKDLLNKIEEEFKDLLTSVKGLQEDIKNALYQIKYEVREIQILKENHEDEHARRKELIQELEEESDQQQKLLEEMNSKFHELENPFKELEIQYKECVQEYSALYQKNSAEKYHLIELTNLTKKTENEYLQVESEKKRLEKTIKILSNKYSDILNKHMIEAEEIEAQIYKQFCRLKFLKKENYILKRGIEDFQEKIQDLSQDNISLDTLLYFWKRILRQLRKVFMIHQKKIEESELIAVQRDEPYLDRLRSIAEVVEYNSALVRMVLEKMTQRAQKLNQKWGKIEMMRPTQGLKKDFSRRLTRRPVKSAKQETDRKLA